MPSKDSETYLGDAVYASFGGYSIELRTGDGNNQVIYLDKSVYDSLVVYAKEVFNAPPRS